MTDRQNGEPIRIRFARPTPATWFLFLAAAALGAEIVWTSAHRWAALVLVFCYGAMCWAAGVMLERYGR